MQVLQSHAASAIQQQRRDVERNDPATVLSLYAQPPAAEQSILDLEDIALARLRGAPTSGARSCGRSWRGRRHAHISCSCCPLQGVTRAAKR